MVKNHSDSERGNPLPRNGLLFPISSQGSFICTVPDRIAYNTTFVTPVVEHCLEREIAQWVHPMKDQSDDPSHHERTLYLWATSRSLDWSNTELTLKDAENEFPRILIYRILRIVVYPSWSSTELTLENAENELPIL